MTQHFDGLGVPLDQTCLCGLDVAGRILTKAKVTTHPAAVGDRLGQLGLEVTRLGSEADPLSRWLQAGLAALGLPAIRIETRHTKAALGAMPVKTD